MGISQVEHQFRSLHLGAVANAVDIQVFRETLGYANNHVVHKGAGQTVQRAVLLGIARAFYGQNAIFLHEFHCRGKVLRQRALRAFYSYGVAVTDRDCHSAGNRDRKFSDS